MRSTQRNKGDKGYGSIRVTAKTVSDAITEASIQLETSSDNIEYTVIDEGSKGFFGIGSRKAMIEARKKFTDEDLMQEVFGEKKEKAEKPKREPKKEMKKEQMPELKKEAAPEKKEATHKPEKRENREVKKEPRRPAAVKPTEKEAEKPQEKPERPAEVAEEAVFAEPKQPRVPADPEEAKRRAVTFLTDMFRVMDMQIEVHASFEDDTLSVDLSGEEMGLLIGKRGQTLDSLQYLTSLVVNKGKASYVRVKLDTEDYRNRRKATLENLAKNIAFKVKKTRRPVFLEPMNPYERRIIHSALQNDPYVTTHSEGEEPNRKVVVTPRRKNERGGNEGGRREYRRSDRSEYARRKEQATPAGGSGRGAAAAGSGKLNHTDCWKSQWKHWLFFYVFGCYNEGQRKARIKG